MYALIFAFLSPMLFGLMNVLDKYVVALRVKNARGYMPLVGIANIIISACIGLFLDWSGVTLRGLIFPMLAGVILGIQSYFYFFMLEKEDVSHIIGYAYVYPVVVALLSFLFLGERLSSLGYIGVMVILLGVVLLSVRARQVNMEARVWFLGSFILLIAFQEFFVKVSTASVTGWQGVVVNNIMLGVVLLCGLATTKSRTAFRLEKRNLKWAFLTEVFTFGAILTLYLAMEDLPATIVCSISAMQPLAVLVFERIAEGRIGKITKDHLILPKLGAIIIIVAGVVMLTMS